MHVEVIIRIDGRDLATVKSEIRGAAREREEQIQELKQRVGGPVMEQALQEIADAVPRPICCGRSMKSRGRAPLTVTSLSGIPSAEATSLAPGPGFWVGAHSTTLPPSKCAVQFCGSKVA